MNIKQKLLALTLTILFVIIAYLTCFLVVNFNNSDTKKVNFINEHIPYSSNNLCICLICENYLIFYELENSNTNVYSIDLNNHDNRSIIIDNISDFSKKSVGINIERQFNINFNVCEEIINSCGGVEIINTDGEAVFLHGNEFKNLIINSQNQAYISYLFGILLKNVFENQLYSYIYDYSDLSYMDVTNNMDFFKKSTSKITCIELEVS